MKTFIDHVRETVQGHSFTLDMLAKSVESYNALFKIAQDWLDTLPPGTEETPRPELDLDHPSNYGMRLSAELPKGASFRAIEGLIAAFEEAGWKVEQTYDNADYAKRRVFQLKHKNPDHKPANLSILADLHRETEGCILEEIIEGEETIPAQPEMVVQKKKLVIRCPEPQGEGIKSQEGDGTGPADGSPVPHHLTSSLAEGAQGEPESLDPRDARGEPERVEGRDPYLEGIMNRDAPQETLNEPSTIEPPLEDAERAMEEAAEHDMPNSDSIERKV